MLSDRGLVWCLDGSCLDHPNVVSLYGVQMNPLAMVMEYAPKGDLHRLLNSRQKGTVRCNHSTHNLPLSLRKRTPHPDPSRVVWQS